MLLVEAERITTGVVIGPTVETKEEEINKLLGRNLIIDKVLCRKAIKIIIAIIRMMIRA